MTTTSTDVITFPSSTRAARSGLGQIIGALALCVGLAGCGAMKLGYNNLPQLTGWWLDRYLDFDDTQAPLVREALVQVHQWHRTQELPRYTQLLRRLEDMVAADTGAEPVCRLIEEGRERLDALAGQAEPAMAAVAVTLTAPQLRAMAQRHERSNEEFRRDWIDPAPAQRLERRTKQFVERLERVYGKLDEPQRAVLRQQLEASRFDARQTLAERRRRQADTLQTLRQLQAPSVPLAEARRQMQGLLERSQSSPDPAARRYQETQLQETCAAIAAVHNATTAQQRQGAVKRLRSYQRDFSDLVAQR